MPCCSALHPQEMRTNSNPYRCSYVVQTKIPSPMDVKDRSLLNKMLCQYLTGGVPIQSSIDNARQAFRRPTPVSQGMELSATRGYGLRVYYRSYAAFLAARVRISLSHYSFDVVFGHSIAMTNTDRSLKRFVPHALFPNPRFPDLIALGIPA